MLNSIAYENVKRMVKNSGQSMELIQFKKRPNCTKLQKNEKRANFAYRVAIGNFKRMILLSSVTYRAW